MNESQPPGAGEAVRRKGSFTRTVRAVGGSFFGVRKARDLERDAKELNPLHVVMVAVAAVVIFVVVLVVLVNWVIASGVAA